MPVLFGEGAVEKLGEKVKELGCKKVMCVYGSSVKKTGIADRAKESLKKAGIDYAVYEGIQADPTDVMVNECGALGVKEKVDGYIGIGGGSAMDCAKAAALLTNDLRLAMTMAPRMEAGMVHVNDNTVMGSRRAPFGGVKNSGLGREDSTFSIEEFTELKWITYQTEPLGYSTNVD